MNQNELKAVASNGEINITGRVAVPNPSYTATLEAQVTRNGLGDITLNRTSNGGIAAQVIVYRDIRLTIPDGRQKDLLIEERIGGETTGSTFRIPVER